MCIKLQLLASMLRHIPAVCFQYGKDAATNKSGRLSVGDENLSLSFEFHNPCGDRLRKLQHEVVPGF
jgi:hypothetical protein